MNDSKHTPTPNWKVQKFVGRRRVEIQTENGLFTIAECEPEEAERIVRAVNSFDAMREALEDLAGYFDTPNVRPAWGPMVRKARAALALADGDA